MSTKEERLRERAYFSARLKEVLGLDGSPVAEAILREKPEGVPQWQGEPIWVCGAIEYARRGDVFYVAGENISCPGKAFIGIAEPPPQWIAADYLVEGKKLYASRAAAARHIQEVWKNVPRAGGEYFAFAPLEKATFEPDAVIFIVKPLQAMRIMFLDAFETGFHELAPYCEPFCSGVMAGTIAHGKIGLDMLCPGSRQQARFKPEELGLGVPYDRMARIVRSIEGSQLGVAMPDNEAGSRLLGRRDKIERLVDLDAHLKNKG